MKINTVKIIKRLSRKEFPLIRERAVSLKKRYNRPKEKQSWKNKLKEENDDK
jgi:hypothetical protein